MTKKTLEDQRVSGVNLLLKHVTLQQLRSLSVYYLLFDINKNSVQLRIPFHNAQDMKNILFALLLLLIAKVAAAQQVGHTIIDGQVFPFMLDGCGDTVVLATLEDISVSSPHQFKDEEEMKKYRRYRKFAAEVYPYAVEAVKVFREIEYYTSDMHRRERKEYMKQLQKDLKERFEDPIKNLSKTRGYILIKMIERELQIPTYTLVKELKGGFTATYWSTLGSFYGYHLKDGYKVGEDHILDLVLDDFNVSYEVRK